MGERIRGRLGVALRKRRLEAEPICRDCKEQGIKPPRLAVVPDHIKPLALGGEDVDENVRCLCAEHHRVRTAEQFGQRLRPTIGADGWHVE
jgi:5-methylcytosine-specific restriction protein A